MYRTRRDRKEADSLPLVWATWSWRLEGDQWCHWYVSDEEHVFELSTTTRSLDQFRTSTDATTSSSLVGGSLVEKTTKILLDFTLYRFSRSPSGFRPRDRDIRTYRDEYSRQFPLPPIRHSMNWPTTDTAGSNTRTDIKTHCVWTPLLLTHQVFLYSRTRHHFACLAANTKKRLFTIKEPSIQMSKSNSTTKIRISMYSSTRTKAAFARSKIRRTNVH